ncbi:unnamed protein product [Oppiella nova]|uniref:Uncharacterized protein n=1 Tax=Oppiella nova TaxID=334625 RepID=A0A7R9M8Y2_9ACAR|nr:unnamed protein product [Oppiella nova]CAG2172980.1 unnamed protein product [Oppiella nova]
MNRSIVPFIHHLVRKCDDHMKASGVHEEDTDCQWSDRLDDNKALQMLDQLDDNICMKNHSKTMSMSSKTSIKSNGSEERYSTKSLKSGNNWDQTQTRLLPIKDTYCWDCHKNGVDFSCKACLRSYHQKCSSLKRLLSQSVVDSKLCPECTDIMGAEEGTNPSGCMQWLNGNVEELSELLRYTIETVRAADKKNSFYDPVSATLYPEYRNLIVNPMDLSLIETNIHNKLYASTNSFLADIKWVYHNCIVFNSGVNQPLISEVKNILRVAKQECEEIEICPDCYRNYYTMEEDNYFAAVCRRPHAIVWAKLKGHPYWPAKVVRYNELRHEVDVRFFGTHDKDKHRLKTLLSRHQLLNHFYDKLYHNCIQMNGNRRRSPRKQTNSKLRSTQTQLLSQIRMISECDKSAKVCLPRHPSLDTPVHRLFKEKSTQYQVTDCLSQHIPKEHIKELVECNGITDNGCHHKPDDKSAKCIDIDINEASDGESTPRLDVTVECSNQLMNTKSVGASDAIIHETNGVDNKMSPKDLKCKAIKSFVCSYCDKGYKIKKNLNKHITRTHKYITSESIKTDDMTPNVPELPEVTETKPQIAAKMETTIACQWPNCGLTLTNRTQFLRHQTIHSVSRKVCTQCGLRFDDSELLRQHMMYHSNQSVNQFEMKAFKSQMPLNGNHMNHSNGMDYTYGWDSSQSIPQTHPINDHSEHNTANNRAVLLFCHFPNCHYKTSNCHHLEVHQKRAHDTVYMSL